MQPMEYYRALELMEEAHNILHHGALESEPKEAKALETIAKPLQELHGWLEKVQRHYGRTEVA